MTVERNRYLQLMGIDEWVLRMNENDLSDQHGAVNQTIAIDKMGWEELEHTVKNCQRCALHQTRTQAVFGVGSHSAELLIIGEAPGMYEDKKGEPFVGRAGQLLNAMLTAIGLERDKIYIANILKSRPPKNRDPSSQEIEACTPYLLRQITLIQPKVLLALGRIAAQYLLGTNVTMGQLRGNEFEYGPLRTKLLVTYHPAYLLRSPTEKRKAWQDMQKLHAVLQTHN